MIQRSVQPIDCDRLEIAKPCLDFAVSHLGCITPRFAECRDDPSVTRCRTSCCRQPDRAGGLRLDHVFRDPACRPQVGHHLRPDLKQTGVAQCLSDLDGGTKRLGVAAAPLSTRPIITS